jgi:hypothetical protein
MKLGSWLAGMGALVAMVGAHGRQAAAAPEEVVEDVGLVTLYANDPITHDYSFRLARHGAYFEDFMLKNAGADIDFSVWYPDELTVGLEAGTRGQILDLGGLDVLQDKYRFDETIGGGQGFASIRRDITRNFVILRDLKHQVTQPLGEGRLISRAANHAPVVTNHVYLIRIATTGSPSVERFVKLMVIKHEPGVSVTFRWAIVD